MDKLNVQYGCGLSAPENWVNFDSSPTLRLQRSIIGPLIQNRLNVKFPGNVKYGDIVKGLPVSENSCDCVYCSHVLEHLSLEDFRLALQNTFDILKPGGLFRLVMPDLEYLINDYNIMKNEGNPAASIVFLEKSILGKQFRRKGFKGFLTSFLGNSNHLWLWDYASVKLELESVGFSNIRKCEFNDSDEEAFLELEDKGRFENALAVESKK